MALTDAEARQIWARFANSPLFAKWPQAVSSLPMLLERAPIPQDSVIYEPGDAPAYLYLVAGGGVEETILHDGQVWLRQQLAPGDFFGQRGLFTNQYRSRAVVAPGTVLYQMRAGNLRAALEMNPGLQEELFREQRSGRLRRVPLFRALSDEQIRWLAQIVREQDFPKGAFLPLDAQPGLWLVDWGQLLVKGPANPHPENWEAWGISAGNFCIGLEPSTRFGRNSAAASAQANVSSHLYYLPTAATDRLVAAFPDVGNQMARPLDAARDLAEAEPMAALGATRQQHLAQYAAWEFIPSSQNITTQGYPGHTLVVLRDGAAVVTAVDERGRGRPRNYLSARQSYGRTSLLEGKVRDATVRAVQAPEVRGQPGLDGAEIISLQRQDMQHAFAQRRDLWGRGVSLVDQMVQTKEEKQPFEWMDEGETIRWSGRPHILWLIAPEAGVALLALVLLGAWVLLPNQARSATIPLELLGLAALAVLSVLVLVNYLDDYYVLTNRRLTRRDRLLLLHESRVEAPLDMVQDVTIIMKFWGRVFNYGHLAVATASKQPPIVLSHTPSPEEVRAKILQGRTEAQAAGYGKQAEVLRRGLIQDLQLALPIPDRTPALGVNPEGLGRKNQPNPPASQELLPGMSGGRPQWVNRSIGRLPARWQSVLVDPNKPQPKPLPGQIIWRKHWIVLLRRTWLPFLILILLSALGVSLLVASPEVAGLSTMGLCLPVMILGAAAAGWLWYQWEDWRNDIYVLTDEKIIDIEKKPLGISAKRREGGLDRVQNVEAKQVGVIATLFDYGDVVIATAAEDEGYTFFRVAHPKRVQATVFQRLDAFRRKQAATQAEQRQRELVDGLRVYHQLQAEQAARNQGRR